MDIDNLIPQITTLLTLIVTPLLSKKVEHNLEYFFLIVSIIAVGVTNTFSYHLLEEALLHPVMISNIPIGITQVVLVAGLVFYYNRRKVTKLALKLNNPTILSIVVFILGLTASLISAIVASVIFAELLALSRLPRNIKVKVAIAAAFSIGIGATLLPLGEPLSTIAIAKLKDPPYNANFTFLLEVLWDLVIPLVVTFSLLVYIYVRKSKGEEYVIEYNPNLREVITRAIKVYIFIFSLTLLGEFFKPLAEPVAKAGIVILYLFGIISAAADNATLTAALVSSEMNLEEIRAFIISLVITGGFLIPGNVPNIVFSNILKIGFKEWARIAIPIGMLVYVGTAFAIFGLAL